jgi:hypothetical protein
MTKQNALASFVVHLLPFATVFFIGMQTATAKQCSVSMPSNPHGHWSYRLIDGRRCWYEGQNNLSKSLLKWSDETALTDKASPPLEKERLAPAKEARTAIPETPSNAANHGPMVETPDTFEARWRSLVSRQ